VSKVSDTLRQDLGYIAEGINSVRNEINDLSIMIGRAFLPDPDWPTEHCGECGWYFCRQHKAGDFGALVVDAYGCRYSGQECPPDDPACPAFVRRPQPTAQPKEGEQDAD